MPIKNETKCNEDISKISYNDYVIIQLEIQE